MSANELTSKVRELKELKAMAEELATEITTIEDEIKAEMTARNTDEMTVDDYRITQIQHCMRKAPYQAHRPKRADKELTHSHHGAGTYIIQYPLQKIKIGAKNYEMVYKSANA